MLWHSPSDDGLWAAEFLLCVGWSSRLQLFNFAHGWEHLWGNHVHLFEQPEIGRSVKCAEEKTLQNGSQWLVLIVSLMR